MKSDWTTFDELFFIDNIGSFSKIGSKKNKELLKNYISSCFIRKDWDGIDSKEVINTSRLIFNGLRSKLK